MLDICTSMSLSFLRVARGFPSTVTYICIWHALNDIRLVSKLGGNGYILYRVEEPETKEHLAKVQEIRSRARRYL